MNPRSLLRLLLLAVIAGGLGLIGAGPALAAVVTWDGDAGDGLWITKENWSGDELPGAGDDVIIGAAFGVNHTASTHTIRSLTVDGSLTILGGLLEFTQASQINGTLTIGALQDFPGGTLHGTGPLTIANPLNWFGGTMSGNGLTDALGGISIAGVFGKTLNGRILNNPGTTSWSGQGDLGIGLGAVFRNQGTFDVQNNESVVFTGGSGATFLNIGTFNKGGGGPTTFGFSVQFFNTGTVNIQGGASLVLFGGGTSTGGTFDSAAGSSVDFRSGTYTLTDAKFTGAGLGRVAGATVLLTGRVNASNFEVASGNLGGAGNLVVASTLRWTGGTMSGSLNSATISGGSMEISGPLDKTLTGRTLRNRGTAVWTGMGNIGIGGEGRISNQASFSAQNDASIVFAGGNSAFFTNLGTFTKSVRDGVTSVSAGVRFDPGQQRDAAALGGRGDHRAQRPHWRGRPFHPGRQRVLRVGAGCPDGRRGTSLVRRIDGRRRPMNPHSSWRVVSGFVALTSERPCKGKGSQALVRPGAGLPAKGGAMLCSARSLRGGRIEIP